MGVEILTKSLTDFYFVASIADRDRDGRLSAGDKIRDRDRVVELTYQDVADGASLAQALEKVTTRGRIVISKDSGYLVYSQRGSMALDGILDVKKFDSISVSAQNHTPENAEQLKNRIRVQAAATCNTRSTTEKKSCQAEWVKRETKMMASLDAYNQELSRWRSKKDSFSSEFMDESLSDESVTDYIQTQIAVKHAWLEFKKTTDQYLKHAN